EYVHAVLLAHPEDGTARIRSFGSSANLLGRPIRSVEVLGVDGEVTWTQTPDALEVAVPGPTTPHSGPVVKVRLQTEDVPERTDHLHG
ncbi:MAG: alpha-L-fucosidase C-terminal domain-containing protein, partial [Microbacterium sp.]